MSEQAPPRFGEGAWKQRAALGRPATLVGLALSVALVGVVLWSAFAGTATAARHPRIVGGSIVLDDYRPLVALDLATGDVTVRLEDVFAEVGANTYADVQAVPLSDGTLLVNRQTGEFNILGKDNFVLKTSGGGVGLGQVAGSKSAVGVADGPSAFIVRSAPRSAVSLVGADTVEAAARLTGTGSARTVPPRGFARLAGPVAPGPGALVQDGGDLWVAVVEGRAEHLVDLQPDPANPRGMILQDRGVIGAATRPEALDAGPGEVAVATPGRIQLVPLKTGSRPVTVPTPATARARRILPVGGGGPEMWFASQSPAGWVLLGVDSAGGVSGPHRLAGIPASARLVPPVVSGGGVFTMDRPASGQPTLWQVSPRDGAVRTVPGAATYPRESPSERADFSAAEVVTTPGRVIFDNPDSLLGVVVFTDHRQAPVIFDKSTAVTVSATGPVAVAGNKPSIPQNGSPKTPAPTVPPADRPSAPLVNQQISCQNTTQTPRAPQITSVVPSAHGATISWAYPLLDEQDCEPDSWAVTVRAINAPQPSPATQVESGQLQYQFNGLRPTTTYQVTVTAFIRSQSTASAPSTFTTTATGPDAPTSVHTAADNNGDWVVSWTPCTAANCYVPAATWVVTGAACGAGFVGQPPSVQVSGGQTSVTIPSAPGGLLGDSLTFQVQGLTPTGLAGDATSDHACTEAWRPPDPSHIALKASAVPSGQSVTATLAVVTDEAPVDAFGSNATTFTYQVGNKTVGPTAQTTVTVPGLQAGASYTPSVSVAPAGHPEAAVTVTGSPFTQTLPWPPALTMQASGAVDPSNPDSGTITAGFPGAPPVPLSASGQLICSSESANYNNQPLNASGQVAVPIDLISMGGSCSMTATLTETSTDEYGVPSRQMQANFSVGTQVDQTTFSASYQQGQLPGTTNVVVNGNPAGKGDQWNVAVTNPIQCNTVSQSSPQGPPTFPVVLQLGACDVTGQPVTVSVSYTYLGTQVNFDVTPGGTPPTTSTTTSTTTTTTTTTSSTSTTVARSTTTTAKSTTTTKAAALAGGSSPAAAIAPPGDTPPAPAELAGAVSPASGKGAASGPLPAELAIGAAIAIAALLISGRPGRGRRRN